MSFYLLISRKQKRQLVDNVEKIKKIEDELKKKDRQIKKINKILKKIDKNFLLFLSIPIFVFAFFIPAIIITQITPPLNPIINMVIWLIFLIIAGFIAIQIQEKILSKHKGYQKTIKIFRTIKEKKNLLIKEKKILLNQLKAEDFFNIKERIKNVSLIDEMVHSFETRSQIRTESEILHATFKKLLSREVLSREERDGIHKLLDLYEKEKDMYIDQTREERIKKIVKTKENIVNIENE
tara:strand:- start:4157 stop:4870 length:714 start_codon:yes stop_codon:yes gene_type:complete